MSKQKRQFAKKKEREKNSKQKVLARRERILQKTKEMKMWEKEERESRSKQNPIKNVENMSPKLKQLMHNLQIIEALNEEHEKGNI